MNIAPIRTSFSFCDTVLSPSGFFITLSKRVFSFLQAIFLWIGTIFSTPPKREISVIEKPLEEIVPSVIIAPNAVYVPSESPSPRGEECVPESEIAQTQPVAESGVLLSHKGQMLFEMKKVIHPEMARVFERLLSGLDIITSWNYNEQNGSYRIEMSEAIKVWVPQGNDDEAPIRGTIIRFGPVVSGRFESESKIIHFTSGFEIDCLFFVSITIYIRKMVYRADGGNIVINAGRLGQTRDKFKQVDDLIKDWGKIENRRK